MNQFWQQLVGIWSRMNFVSRAIAGVVVTGFLLAMLWSVARPVPMTTLYSDLPLEDLGQVTRQLDADGIPYEIDGATLRVASSSYDQTRLNMAMAGLPVGSGKGYELFDGTDLDMSPMKQRINETRALQGELQRTIGQLDPVRQARVHIVLPDFTPFLRDQRAVTASVVITPRSGSSLSSRQVDGIVAFVSASVQGLERGNVTVIDSRGRQLSKHADDPDSNVSGDQLAYQREVEGHLADKAQTILNSVLGHGQAVVRVTADMDFRTVKEMSESFDQENRALVSEVISNSKSEENQEPQGVAGAASNLSPVVPAAFSTSGGNSNEEMIESKWSPSRVVHEYDQKLNAVQRLTVAVMLIPPNPADGQSEEEALGMSKLDAEELVKQAVGFKADRDEIQVTMGRPLIEEVVVDDVTPWFLSGEILMWASVFVGAVAFLMIALAIRKTLAAQRDAQGSAAAALAGEDLRNLETMAEALRVWVDTE